LKINNGETTKAKSDTRVVECGIMFKVVMAYIIRAAVRQTSGHVPELFAGDSTRIVCPNRAGYATHVFLMIKSQEVTTIYIAAIYWLVHAKAVFLLVESDRRSK